MSRRLNQEGTISEVKNRNLFLGQIRIKLDDGTKYRKKVYARTRREVQQKLREISDQQEQALLSLAKDETVGEYLLRWYDNPDLRPKTVHSREVNINRITSMIGGVKLRDLRAPHIKRLYERLGDQLSSYSVVQAHAVLRKALKDAVIEGTLSASPLNRLVNAPKARPREVETLTREEVSLLFSVDDDWQPLWVLLIATGLRIGEALGLSWDNVDLDGRRLMVRRSLQSVKGRGLIFQPPKTSKSRRTLLLPNTAAKALRTHLRRQAEHRLRAGPSWKDNSLVFPNEWGAPMEPTRVNRALDKSLRKAGLDRHVRVHDLRHTAATLALGEGLHPKVVQEMLGHSTISLTMDVYSHVLPTLQQDAADRMDDVLRTAS